MNINLREKHDIIGHFLANNANFHQIMYDMVVG